MKKGEQIRLLLRLYKLVNNGDGRSAKERKAALQRLEKKLDPSVLRRYHRLKDRKGTGVAIMKDRICSECKMIYPETHEILKYRNFVHSCEYCGRLLVVTDKSA
jgi:predicted  nucleic acid-binding Zn-ribbon protein